MKSAPRIAWLGPVPSDQGAGVAYAATLLIEALVAQGAEVDCFLPVAENHAPDRLAGLDGLRIFCIPPSFRYGAWYSPNDITKFVSGTVFNAKAQVELAQLVARQHESRRYDALYQFSHLETAALRPVRRRLPPVVLHPEVHAAGELRWLIRERRLARAAGQLGRLGVATAAMTTRAAIQGAGVRSARTVVAPSRRFAQLLAQDYRIRPERLRVVPNPIDVGRFAMPETTDRDRGTVTLLYVSRLAVRKGVDQVVGLTNRLSDLSGRVRIRVIGDRSLFSDYRPLLARMDPVIGTYLGAAAAADVHALYRTGDALIQPSTYEPFALTVGEALASGLPVVATDEVGATEGVDRLACRVSAAGDLDGLEREVRALVTELQDGARRAQLSRVARAEAERLFSPETVGPQLLDAIVG